MSNKQIWPTAIGFLGIIAVVLFFYYDRHDVLSTIFRSWGVLGIFAAILFMAVLCMTPIPSESLLVLYLHVYGVGPGVVYSWLGSIVSSLIVFVVARVVGKPLLKSMITDTRFDSIDNWIGRHGTSGLLILRLLPIPGFLVSYVVGTIPSVGLWKFVWTAAVTVIPYYMGASLIYLGVASHLVIWIGVGFIGLCLFWLTVWMLRKRWLKSGTTADLNIPITPIDVRRLAKYQAAKKEAQKEEKSSRY